MQIIKEKKYENFTKVTDLWDQPWQFTNLDPECCQIYTFSTDIKDILHRFRKSALCNCFNQMSQMQNLSGGSDEESSDGHGKGTNTFLAKTRGTLMYTGLSVFFILGSFPDCLHLSMELLIVVNMLTSMT